MVARTDYCHTRSILKWESNPTRTHVYYERDNRAPDNNPRSTGVPPPPLMVVCSEDSRIT